MKNEKTIKKHEKKYKKNSGKIAFFHFFGKLLFSSSFFSFFSLFFHFFQSFFIIFYQFSSIPPLEAKMIKKNDEKMKKKLEENGIFFIFRKIFAPLEAKMMKNAKKNEKKLRENCNSSFF